MSSNKILLLFYISLSCLNVISGVNNGKVVSSDHFKFVVGIRKRTIMFEAHCTGGVIHKYFVSTAAHCFAEKKSKNPSGGHFYEYKKFKLSVYSNTDSTKIISKNAIKRAVTDVYFVKQFFENGIDDIAILKLDGTLNDVLILPSSDNIYFDKVAVIAGYGDDPVGDKINKKFQWNLKTMHIKTIHIRSCQRVYPKLDIPVNADKQLCSLAFEHGKSYAAPSCPLGVGGGDSGAPIVFQGNIILGIVSRGPANCDARDYPELSMRVSHYLDFIDAVINDKPMNPEKFVHYRI